MAKQKFENFEQTLAYVNTLPIREVIEDYARILWESQSEKTEPIKITEAQLKSFFKVVGYTKDGGVEKRGRKPKQN